MFTGTMEKTQSETVCSVVVFKKLLGQLPLGKEALKNDQGIKVACFKFLKSCMLCVSGSSLYNFQNAND